MRTLAELVKKYDAMKPAYYLPFYEELFAPFRNQEISILEIGVCWGNSLRTWAEYFPRARIHGIDLQIPKGDFVPRVRIHRGDQSDAAFLERVAQAHGPFQFIIDDGSHKPAHWLASYRALFQHLVPGGTYAIEDIQAPRHVHAGWPPEAEKEIYPAMLSLAGHLLRQEPQDAVDWMRLHLHIAFIRKYKDEAAAVAARTGM